MKLKKTIAMMILAGALTTSLTACVVKGDQGDRTKMPSGTESPVTPPSTPIVTPPPVQDPTQAYYTPVDEIVYIVSPQATLKKETNVAETQVLPQLYELHRIGKNTTWSKVEINGVNYFVATSALTTDDLGERTFSPCNKTMYVNVNSVNVRTYPSADNFSLILGGRSLNNAIKVIAENGTWSKIEWTEDGKTKHGFIKSEFLSAEKVNEEVADYLKYFTALNEPVTMYISAEAQANMRLHPYADKRGTIIQALPNGTPVTVVAKGTVENIAWCMVSYKEGSVNKQYYIAESALSATVSGDAALEDVLAAYPTLVKFDAALTLYVSAENTANGRSTPTRLLGDDGKPNNIVKTLIHKETVKAVASGKIAGKTPDGKAEEITWCLIEDAELGFYFVALSNLTPNADGKPGTVVFSLDHLIAMYEFEKMTEEQMQTAGKINLMSAPNADSVVKEVAAGTVVTVLAKGQTGDFVKNDWYIVEFESTYYFVIQNDLEGVVLAD
jgi:uncharacterized protein YgiM (DUF1202 family)